MEELILRIRETMRTGQFVNEASITNGVVLPILNALGWPVFDTTVVAPEYTVEGRRVDIALCHPRSRPAVFVEVKQPGRSEVADRQLFEYAFHAGVPLALLTDGKEWHFYLPAGQGHYQERRVYRLDLAEREIEEAVRRLHRYLAYSAVTSGEASRAAQEDYASLRRNREVASHVPVAWRKLLQDRDELLVDLLSDQVESLCGFKPDPDLIDQFLSKQVEALQFGDLAPPMPVELPAPPKRPTATQPPESPRRRRRASESASAPMGFSIGGEHTPTRNAIDTLIQFFEAMAHRDSSFLERFAALPRHGRRRRFLARDRAQLYPGRADLVDYSHELAPGWWIGTNYGSVQIRRIIGMACDVGGLRSPGDVEVYL